MEKGGKKKKKEEKNSISFIPVTKKYKDKPDNCPQDKEAAI